MHNEIINFLFRLFFFFCVQVVKLFILFSLDDRIQESTSLRGKRLGILTQKVKLMVF